MKGKIPWPKQKIKGYLKASDNPEVLQIHWNKIISML